MPSPSLIVLTGAGVSAESGLATFRDADGLWAKVRLEEVATPEAFARDPSKVHGFYNARRRALLDPAVQPNAAHRALAALEAAWPGEFLLVTQNVDNLHERAGSRRLHHLHGELLKSLCTRCGDIAECRVDLSAATVCATCGRAGGMRPRVVWFGEMPLEMETVYRALGGCAIFVSIGTSGTVYPAAGFVEETRAAGARTIEVNLDPSASGSRFDEALIGRAGETVPVLVERLLADQSLSRAKQTDQISEVFSSPPNPTS